MEKRIMKIYLVINELPYEGLNEYDMKAFIARHNAEQYRAKIQSEDKFGTWQILDLELVQ